MTAPRRYWFPLAIAVSLTGVDSAAQDRKPDPPLGAAIIRQLDELFGLADANSPAAGAARTAIWRACAIEHGAFDALFRHLQERRQAATARPLQLRILRTQAHYLRRLGDLQEARRVLDEIAAGEETLADILAKAEVLDALGADAAAIAAYDRLLARKLPTDLQNKILLRKALMSGSQDQPPAGGAGGRRRSAGAPLPLIRRGGTAAGGSGRRPPPAPTTDPAGKPAERSPLARFAARPDLPRELKNQAAMVLALTNEQQAAIEVFQPHGEGTPRFRQEVRLAEWAIEAGDHPAAQQHAWEAVRSAKLKRDRRYALSLLVEGYRRAGKLDDLIAKFEATADLGEEAREVWIDLLRERGRVAQALELFQKTGRFTVDMRRELLEICRESDDESTLATAYQKLIREEPRFLEWREGLSRFYLERGKRDAAVAVWRPYLQVTEDQRYRMAAAATLMELGLDDLAIEFARACMTGGNDTHNALLFLFELHNDRGRHQDAGAALAELDKVAPPGAGVRKEMADAYARLGDKRRAVDILERLYATLGTETTPDTRMKLALMLSEVGREEDALAHWTSLWRQINSVPRRRYVEERLMAVAARLGTLAKVAIDLEKKLIAGTADDREAGLLVRLYIKVNDPVSATEVIQEHMSKAGKKPVEVLTEKARVFQSCQDFYNYELVIHELIAADPEGAPDYLRQLAMSNMERGARKEAREILERLKAQESDGVSDEFEAGVLALAGMRPQALAAYRRGIARYPERIDTYLLLSNIQKELGRHARSAGMFQYLAATAEKDDLFTIAIDGILNMRDGRSNRGAPDRLVRWARRIVLERVARRPDKLYLLRLVADLSEELRDTAMAMRALKTAVPVAGEQRTSILRELMTMAKTLALPPHLRSASPATIVRMARNQQGEPTAPHPDLLMIGRRILGQGELVPPQTYLELGSAFLNAGEVGNATKTFNQASQLPEFAELRRDFAQAFEIAGYPREALRIYEQILSVQNGDPKLITKVGELLEQTGRDDVARGLYRRGLDLLLDRSVFARTGTNEDGPKPPDNPLIYRPGNRNTDDWQRHHAWMEQGLLATLTPASAKTFLAEQRQQLDAELTRMREERAAGKIDAAAQLSHLPRVERRVTLYRRVAAAFGDIASIDALDRDLLRAFERDATLLEAAVRFRLSWGYVTSARQLIAASQRPEDERKRLRLLAGVTDEGHTSGILTAAEAAGLLLPILVDGKHDAARTVLARMSLAIDDGAALEHMPLLVGAAVYLRDRDLTLTMCRHWLNVAMKTNPARVYQTVESVLRQGRKALDKPQLRSLTEHVLAQVVEKPDRFSSFLRRLPQLRDQAGADFLTREQVEKLIRSRLDASDRFVYGIEDLFALLHHKDRSNVLRAVWGRVPKTQRAYFLLRLVSVLDNEFEDGFRDFLGSAFERALTEADDKRILGYQVENLADNAKVNVGLRLRFIEAMVKAGESGLRMRACRAILCLRLDRKAEAVAAIQEVFEAMFAESGPPRDPMASSAYYRLTRSLGKDHGDTLLAVMDAIEKKRKPSVALTRHRLNLLSQIGRSQEREAALAAAVAKHPKDASLRAQYLRILESRGEQAAALAVQVEDLARQPSNQTLRRKLVTGYRSLRHPVKAWELHQAGAKLAAAASAQARPAKADPPAEAAAAVRKDRTPPATIEAVKKAWDADATADALGIFRRLWRSFSPVVDDPYGSSLRMIGRSNQLVWPAAPQKPKVARPATGKQPSVARNRGGLPEMFLRPLTAEELQRARYRMPRYYGAGSPRQTDGAEPLTAHQVLAGKPAGRQEIERQLRTLPPEQLGSPLARDIYRALVEARVASDSRPQVLADLLARDRAGQCSKIDYGLLAVLLDDLATAAPDKLAESLRGLTGNLNPRDENQVRRLARLHARAGDSAKASALYRWCALLTGSDRGSIYYYRGSDDLLTEVMRNLQGEARIEAVADILAAQDPGEYGRDMYLANVLQTWMELVPPDQVAARSRRALESVTTSTMQPNRNACKLAAAIHARAGEIEAALRCLEIALCKLDPPDNLTYPFYATYYQQPGYISELEVLKLFPKDMSKHAKASAWLTAAANRALAWQAAGRLHDSVPLRLFSALALRLHDDGQAALAAKVAAGLLTFAGDSAADQLWAADVARILGDQPAAFRIERRLFESGQLHIERIPDLVAHILATEGYAAGMAAGERATALTLHPQLLSQLIEAAKAAKDADRQQRFEQLRQQAVTAEQALAEIDRQRIEAARRRAAEEKDRPKAGTGRKGG